MSQYSYNYEWTGDWEITLTRTDKENWTETLHLNEADTINFFKYRDDYKNGIEDIVGWLGFTEGAWK